MTHVWAEAVRLPKAIPLTAFGAVGADLEIQVGFGDVAAEALRVVPWLTNGQQGSTVELPLDVAGEGQTTVSFPAPIRGEDEIIVTLSFAMREDQGGALTITLTGDGIRGGMATELVFVDHPLLCQATKSLAARLPKVVLEGEGPPWNEGGSLVEEWVGEHIPSLTDAPRRLPPLMGDVVADPV